jgi:hypothetical protein
MKPDLVEPSVDLDLRPLPRLFLIEEAADIVALLLYQEGSWSVRQLIEASVRLPERGSIWIATFTGSKPGTQEWRTTGLRDYYAALELAQRWEREAKKEREARKSLAKPPVHRVAGGTTTSPGESPENIVRPLSQLEVARILKMSERAVRQTEKRALAKLRANPTFRKFVEEYFGRCLGEHLPPMPMPVAAVALNPSDIQALLGLARNEFERGLMLRVLRLIDVGPSQMT